MLVVNRRSGHILYPLQPSPGTSYPIQSIHCHREFTDRVEASKRTDLSTSFCLKEPNLDAGIRKITTSLPSDEKLRRRRTIRDDTRQDKDKDKDKDETNLRIDEITLFNGYQGMDTLSLNLQPQLQLQLASACPSTCSWTSSHSTTIYLH